jgi:hypothetical protein
MHAYTRHITFGNRGCNASGQLGLGRLGAELKPQRRQAHYAEIASLVSGGSLGLTEECRDTDLISGWECFGKKKEVAALLPDIEACMLGCLELMEVDLNNLAHVRYTRLQGKRCMLREAEDRLREVEERGDSLDSELARERARMRAKWKVLSACCLIVCVCVCVAPADA